jgi:peptide/nickel transport system substrate-binding protein
MDKLKSLWAKFKVQISFVAGCLVVATSMGTCSFDPSATSEEAVTETTTEAVEVTGVTTEATETVTATEAVTTTEATTAE